MSSRPISRRTLLAVSTGTLLGASGRMVLAQENEGDGDGEEDGVGGKDGDEAEDGDEDDGDGQEGATGPTGETVECLLVDFAFEPGTDQPLVIPPGTTVVFVWETDNHNVVVESQPDEADWEGHEAIENAPYEYEHTFDVEGTYEFHCEPHLGLGMVGTIEVEEGAEAGGGGEIQDLVPETAETLAIATTIALVTVLSLTYAILKYGGTGPARPPE